MSDYGIRLETRGNIAIITIDRPQRLNAFNESMFSELDKVTAELKNNLPRVVIITGAGEKAFSAGFDVNPDNPMVSNLIEAVNAGDEGPAEIVIRKVRDTIDSFISLPIPLIAALNGITYGGGAELATRCDMRVMDPNSVICFSEVRLGLMPDWGGGPTLVRLIGTARAADMILTARKISADEALNLGVINRISEPGQSLEESIRLAEMIIKNGPRAVGHALEVIRQSVNMPLNEALDLEAERAISLIASGECYHGVSAFLTKTKPAFPHID